MQLLEWTRQLFRLFFPFYPWLHQYLILCMWHLWFRFHRHRHRCRIYPFGLQMNHPFLSTHKITANWFKFIIGTRLTNVLFTKLWCWRYEIKCQNICWLFACMLFLCVSRMSFSMKKKELYLCQCNRVKLVRFECFKNYCSLLSESIVEYEIINGLNMKRALISGSVDFVNTFLINVLRINKNIMIYLN